MKILLFRIFMEIRYCLEAVMEIKEGLEGVTEIKDSLVGFMFGWFNGNKK